MGDPVRDGDDGLRASEIMDRQTASGSTYRTALRSADRRPWSLFSQPSGRYPERAFAAGVPAAWACSRALPVSRGQALPPGSISLDTLRDKSKPLPKPAAVH